MLTQAQSQGYNVDGIINGGSDMGAMKQMLDNALKPLVSEQQERLDTQAVEQQATEIYNSFINKYPDAQVHENSLSRLLQEDPRLTVDAAYFKLQSFYAQKGLDWTKPLEVLQQEFDAQKQKQSSVDTQPQPPEGNVTPSNTTNTAQVAEVSTSTDDIIRQAMAEAGIN
jgi:hypothetical protein